MPTKTWISNTASTWATAASWSPAAVPIAGDDVVFTGTNNGQCTVAAATVTVLSLTTTGYTGNLIVNARLTVGGNMTLSSTNNISGTSDITISANSLITSSGATIGCILRFGTLSTIIQLADNMTLSKGLSVIGLPAGSIILRSNVPGTPRLLTLQNIAGVSQYIDYLNVTDIDSSQGCTLWTYKGTVTTSSNWYVMVTQPPTVSSVSFT
jgi:hypothetical protein